MPNSFNFIAIEGVIGAGKTTLAKLLSERHNARLVLEEFEENPFLPKFYEDRERYAFQTQLAFLASRFKQQQKMTNRDLFDDFIMSDYIFEKDRIFARLNLDDDEMALYDNIFGIMTGISAKPDLIIYLQSSVERLMRNIEQRGRDYERHITESYLKELGDAYNQFFYHYTKTPLMIVNATEIDFLHNPNHLSYLEEQIFDKPIRSNTHIHIIPE
ncbi:MAG: deoxynucleoside kinase [Balneolaceae bacterium]